LFDDDIVSLTALTVMLDPNCRVYSEYVSFTQLTLSLYLMTQCQLKLRHWLRQSAALNLLTKDIQFAVL